MKEMSVEEQAPETAADVADDVTETPASEAHAADVADDVAETPEADAGGTEAGTAGEAAGAEVARLQAELEATRDQLMRQAAEFRNYRRRTEAEKQQLIELGQSLVVQHVLDVLDDFGRSLEAVEQVEERQADPQVAYDQLKQGLALVYRKFQEELQRLGVEAIEAVGTVFDERVHEAVMQQPAPDGVEPGTVLAELQKGYRMGERVLRHSKVVVAA